MSCTSSLTLTSQDDLAATSGADLQHLRPKQRRRHSFFIPRRKSLVDSNMDGDEGILLKVCCLADVNSAHWHLLIIDLDRLTCFSRNWRDGWSIWRATGNGPSMRALRELLPLYRQSVKDAHRSQGSSLELVDDDSRSW